MSKLMKKNVYNAAINGDLTIFTLETHDELLKKTYQNNNIIHVAAQHQQLRFIEAALNTFSTPTSESLLCDQNKHGNTPLHVASEVGDQGVVDRLHAFFSTQYDDDGNQVFPSRLVNRDGDTPAHVALLFGNVAVAMYLVEKDDGYVARVGNRCQETLLHLAMRYLVFDNNSYESRVHETRSTSSSTTSREDLWPIIERLLNIESSVTCLADTDGLTPLHRATSLGPTYCLPVIKAMLASCPEAAEVCDEGSGHTVLHLLTNHQVSGYEQGVELVRIPQVYALRNCKDRRGDTPLHLAARNRDSIMVRVLLECCSKLGLKNKNGVSAGWLLQQLEEKRIMENPIEHGRRLTNEECEAAIQGNMAFLYEKLDTLGPNFLASKTPQGRNILHILMQCKFHFSLLSQAEEFIGQAVQKLPSLVCQQDSKGDTPLHILVQYEYSYSIVELVSDCLEKVEEDLKTSPWRLKNDNGETPLHVAVRVGNYHPAITLLMLDEEVADYVNNRNQTPLHLLSLHNGCDDSSILDDLISRLINGNAELPYMQDVDGLTPLLIAVRERNTTMIRKLHQLFPDCTKMVDFKGKTLWHLFVSRRVEPNFATSDVKSMLETSEFLIDQDDEFEIRKLMASKDRDGNTPLHVAITNQQFGFALFFLENSYDYLVDWRAFLEVENNEGVSSYDLIGSAAHLPRQFEEYLFKRGNLLQGYRSMYGVPTIKIEEYANTIGVIAALLATITFTAAFTVPGGVDSSNGTPLLLQKVAFQVFIVADMVAMYSSVMVLFCLLWIMTTGHKRESLLLLDVSVFLLQTSFHATLVAFMTGLYVTTIPTIPAIAISTCVSCTLLVVLLHRRLFMVTIVPFCGILIILRRVVGHLSSVWCRIKTNR